MSDQSLLQSRTVFCVWSGVNAMSTNRIQALFSIFNHTACPVAYLNHVTMPGWVKDDYPLHPAFPLLSETHKADYLRVYLMHHYGGGYTDVKLTHKSWRPFFDAFMASKKLCAGYTEISPRGVAAVGGDLENVLRENYQSLIGLCAFIFRPQTELTQQWMNRTDALLDEKHAALRAHPARFPQDQYGLPFSDGSRSEYPLRWTELLGNIFHPLIYEFRNDVLHLPMQPEFQNYR